MSAASAVSPTRAAARHARCPAMTAPSVRLSPLSTLTGDSDLYLPADSMGRMHARLPYALSPQVDRYPRIEAAVSHGPPYMGSVSPLSSLTLTLTSRSNRRAQSRQPIAITAVTTASLRPSVTVRHSRCITLVSLSAYPGSLSPHSCCYTHNSLDLRYRFLSSL